MIPPIMRNHHDENKKTILVLKVFLFVSHFQNEKSQNSNLKKAKLSSRLLQLPPEAYVWQTVITSLPQQASPAPSPESGRILRQVVVNHIAACLWKRRRGCELLEDDEVLYLIRRTNLLFFFVLVLWDLRSENVKGHGAVRMFANNFACSFCRAGWLVPTPGQQTKIQQQHRKIIITSHSL